jgi:hypothetical protein
MQRLSRTEPSPARGVDSLSAAFGRLHPETATDLGLEDRARSAGDRLRNALGDVRLLLYAEATLRNPAICAQLRSIAEHAGRDFVGARPLRDYAAERNLEARGDPACLWKPSAAVDRWLSEQRIDVVSRVFDLLWDVCERPEDYPELYADGELTSQLAAVPGTDVVIIAFTVTDGPPRVVHGVHIERDTRFWLA